MDVFPEISERERAYLLYEKRLDAMRMEIQRQREYETACKIFKEFDHLKQEIARLEQEKERERQEKERLLALLKKTGTDPDQVA